MSFVSKLEVRTEKGVKRNENRKQEVKMWPFEHCDNHVNYDKRKSSGNERLI